MKLLSDITENIKILETHGNVEVSISTISLNNNDIQEHSLFTAIVGSVTDGHLFISDAIKKGAKVIVYQNNLENFEHGITYIKVADTKETLALMACNFYNHPSKKLRLVGITGTNGKTTVSTLLHKLFRELGYKAGMIGTVVNKVNDESSEALRTTPDQISLNKLLAIMVDAGCGYCFMEVSSHAISEKRISGLQFASGVFTNLTQDHMDYHKTMEEYGKVKKIFFDMLPATAFALSNKDDQKGKYMLQDSKADKYFYSLKQDAEFTELLDTKLIGEFNAYNILAIYATAVLLGESKEKVKDEIKYLEPVEGRFNYIKSPTGVTGIVDYAHTPDAVKNVLKTIQNLAQVGLGHLHKSDLCKIITVIGCGGDRDPGKRPKMARLAHDMSDVVILTADNPRTEKLENILADMEAGLPQVGLVQEKVYVIPNRHEAIQKACEIAKPGDYVLIAGKGHEKYQEVNVIKTHFDDMEELKKFLK